MIKKLIWFLVIFLVIYIVAVFHIPSLAQNVEQNAGLTGLSKLVENFRSVLYNLPSREEVEDKYNQTLSGAIEFKDNVIEGVEYTKDKIDNVRETLSGAEQTIEKGIEFYEENKGKIEEVKELIDTVSKVSEALSQTGVTE